MSIRSELVAYSESIVAGRIVACTKHRWACERFLRDINQKEWPYRFDEGKAERFLSWMRLFKHRKGILAGQHIEPADIQKFVFGNVYGWINKATGLRRFNKLYWQVARKNAKSQSLACVGSYELMAFKETGEASEVYCAATKTEQAKIVLDDTIAMLEGCDLLKGKFTVAYGRITHNKTRGIMRALSEEDRKTGDGLNPQCGIIDEYHAHETSEMYDIVDSGMGARSEPLLATITTAGFNLKHPCYAIEYKLASKILNPDDPTSIESYFVMINELDINDSLEDVVVDGRIVPPGDLIDDINDENTWIKANPIQCSYPEGRAYVRKKLEETQAAPEKMRNFLTKHMDAWVNSSEFGYLDVRRWAACKGEFPELRGEKCNVGIDLGATDDLASVGTEFLIDGLYYVKSHTFMPEEKYNQELILKETPFDLWVKLGWITVIPGNCIDYRDILRYITEEHEKLGWIVGKVCSDPWHATQINGELIEKGFEVGNVRQGAQTLCEPTKDFRKMVNARRVVHDGNPVLAWAVGNAECVIIDRNANFLLSKQTSRGKIDPLAALINAHVHTMAPEPEGYAERGMRSL